MKNSHQTKQTRKPAKAHQPFVFKSETSTWTIPARDVPKVQRAAEACGFKTIEQLITAWERGDLPRQARDPEFKILPEGATVRLEGITPEVERVLESIARKCGDLRSVQDFLTRAVNGDVAMYLVECLTHPQTGEVLIDCFQYLYREVRE